MSKSEIAFAIIVMTVMAFLTGMLVQHAFYEPKYENLSLKQEKSCINGNCSIVFWAEIEGDKYISSMKAVAACGDEP